ncbi:hypothetical protein [Mycolicibacterium frederiksbergense]
MSARPQSDARTRAFARVLGPYLVIVALAALARASSMATLLAEFKANSGWPWVTGAFVLLGGLIVIALHQNWRGAAAIVVSALGWLTSLKGLLLLVVPQKYLSFGDSVVNAKGWWLAIMAVTALIGLYLAYVGWNPTGNQPQADADRKSTPHLPRAA